MCLLMCQTMDISSESAIPGATRPKCKEALRRLRGRSGLHCDVASRGIPECSFRLRHHVVSQFKPHNLLVTCCLKLRFLALKGRCGGRILQLLKAHCGGSSPRTVHVFVLPNATLRGTSYIYIYIYVCVCARYEPPCHEFSLRKLTGGA